MRSSTDFSSFLEGLSIRQGCCDGPGWLMGCLFCSLRCRLLLRPAPPVLVWACTHFPSFWEGLSLRRQSCRVCSVGWRDFLFFLEGLSLRPETRATVRIVARDFPSFWEGLSLRPLEQCQRDSITLIFPFLFGGAFTETTASALWQMSA